MEKYKKGEIAGLDGRKFLRGIPLRIRAEAFTDLIEAAGVARGLYQTEQLDDEDLREIDLARQKLYLEEITAKYTRLVDRSSQFEGLNLEDAKLEEASKCFLYGFYRATVVLAGSSVEEHLKRATGRKWFDKYETLVSEALKSGKLGKGKDSLDGPANRVFKVRNDVVHTDWNPPEDVAGEILGVARKIVKHLRTAPR